MIRIRLVVEGKDSTGRENIGEIEPNADEDANVVAQAILSIVTGEVGRLAREYFGGMTGIKQFMAHITSTTREDYYVLGIASVGDTIEGFHIKVTPAEGDFDQPWFEPIKNAWNAIDETEQMYAGRTMQ